MEEIQRNIIIQMINCLIKLLLLVKYKKNFLVVFGLFSSDHPSGARPQVTYECDVMKSKLFFFLTLLGYPGPDSSNPSRSRREMASATMKVMSGNIGSNSPTVWDWSLVVGRVGGGTFSVWDWVSNWPDWFILNYLDHLFVFHPT